VVWGAQGMANVGMLKGIDMGSGLTSHLDRKDLEGSWERERERVV
jgi:hypothetical protein